ncbi:MAG: VWA domain-containing protein [Rhodanobacteraceae bacterium]|nr:VWA domain-containing protein [Xanthomonadales bacterium]MCP5477817.1 VWA domain-containing protein [Rhodanobacteraceae bacterium]HPF72752.1 vWA domain-containing protein [Xanthomonadaceae bacterium]HRX99728.1 vWA domain-containing protein [Xanthomonadaceae bacterium]
MRLPGNAEGLPSWLAMLSLLLIAMLPASTLRAADRPSNGEYRSVEVCFVLDTTGSMSNLIEAAKQKIWFIASEIVDAPQKPSVRFCLIGFRDRGDAYVTRTTPLTPDMDRLYADLKAFEADGGGDFPESVNQALRESIEDIAWSDDPNVLKLVFVVGDAPPHTDYDEPQLPAILASADRRGILVNPVLCGSYVDSEKAFRGMQRGRGRFIALPQVHEQQQSTPMDQDLAALNQRLGHTLLPYGNEELRQTLHDNQTRSERMDDATVADRLRYNRATRRIAQGGRDLIEALDAGELSVQDLNPDLLPEKLRSMTAEELTAHLGQIRAERENLKRVIRSLLSQRQTFLDEHRDPEQGQFAEAVAETIRVQMNPTSP